MHIKFKNLKYKNILSTGNTFTEFNLDKYTTNLISGRNGSGKSSMIEAIVFVLYNKPHRKINKPQLMNSINQKDLLVELSFLIGKDEYLIRRGMKPSIFEIWKNNELVNKDSASRDYQLYLEQNILKMSFKSFTQIVILGSATYTPFMELPTGQRREIIEDLLDIQVFSTMNILLKDKIQTNKNLITETSYQIDILKTKVDSIREYNNELKKIKEVEVSKLHKQIEDALIKIENLEFELENLELEVSNLTKTIQDKEKQTKLHKQLIGIEKDLNSKLAVLKKEIQFYSEHDNCPICKQGIQHEFKHEILSEKELKSREIEDAFVKLNERVNLVETRLTDIKETETSINTLNTRIRDLQLEKKLISDQILKIKSNLKDTKKELSQLDTSKLTETLASISNLQKNQEGYFEKQETFNVLLTMLKDGGIKTSIIKTYIPIMNKLINQYLSEFDLFVDFQLDENFNEILKSRFRDTFTFASFSEGEKMRINLAIMFTWRSIAKLRNSVSTNLLIMDETLDSAADSDGVENLIDILHKTNVSDNIFVISHRGDSFREKFENHIKFEKIKNFSVITS
jgi:DNA repair exonuclease SbcCD ATPase subunit